MSKKRRKKDRPLYLNSPVASGMIVDGKLYLRLEIAGPFSKTKMVDDFCGDLAKVTFHNLKGGGLQLTLDVTVDLPHEISEVPIVDG